MTIATRVDYREHQRLRSGDLQAEQGYLLALAARHYLGPHRWGVVRGLDVSVRDSMIVVTPGLAIDGYGRELIVLETVEIPRPQNAGEQFVYLFYCERPQGGCADTPNTRWRDAAEIALSKTALPVPTDEPDLFTAHAAGIMPGVPPWPVLLGRINVDKQRVIDEVPFTRLLAARVASPSGRAMMWIGQENLADLYHFRISVLDGKGSLRNRFAIDRDGNPLIWGNLNLQGTSYEKVFRIAEGQFIKFEARSSGANFLLRAVPRVVQGERVITLSLRNKGQPEVVNQQSFKIGNPRSLQAVLRNLQRRDNRIIASRTPAVAPLREAGRTADEAYKESGALDDRESPMEPSGAILSFDVEDDQAAPERCGCREVSESEVKLPEGLIFQPVVAAPLAPTSRDIYSLVVKKPEAAPEEQVRISGGVFADGDFTDRVTFCGSIDAGKAQPWLSVRGNGGIKLWGGQVNEAGDAYEMIRVTGTAIYPPVKPDPRDPLFNYLVTLAFIKGVLTLSSSLINISFSKMPAVIEIGKEWEYELELHNLSLTTALAMKTSMEVVSSIGSAPTQNFLPIQRLDVNETVKKTIEHKKDDIPHTAKKANIDVSVLMLAGSDPVAGSATSGEIPVYEPPSIDEDNIPDTVAAGQALPFPLVIINGKSEQVTITDIQVEGLAAGSQPFTPNISVLGVRDSTGTTAKPVIPAKAAGDPDIALKITVRYTWKQPDASSSIVFMKDIEVM